MTAGLPRLWLVVALGAALGGLPAPARGAAEPTTPRAGTLQSEHRQLPVEHGPAVEADSGTLWVPENRHAVHPRSIPVRFLRLRSTAAAPRAPLFYLAGGPGSPGVDDDPRSISFWAPFLALCDVVLIDQRGVGARELRWSWDGPPPLAFFTSVDSALAQRAELDRRAGAAFRSRGVDLAGYTTVESATDLDELRAALGVPRVSLLAFSYGTHLACAYLRRYDAHVDNAVILGLEGPDDTWKLPWTMDVQFRRLALLAAADPRIAQDVPDLMTLYDRVIARLAREPVVVKLRNPAGGDSLAMPIGPFGLRLILRFDVGDATDLVVFPRLLWSLDHGDASVLAWFVRKRAGIARTVDGMNEAMDAASGVSPGRHALIDQQSRSSRFADVINFPYPVTAATWGVPDLGEEFRAPLVSGVRVLVVSGGLDCNTPPAQGDALCWGLSNATHLIVADAGHEQTFWQNDTAVPVVVDFLAGQDVAGRQITYPPLRFVPLAGSDSLAFHPSVPR